jgi:hypothetical protein
MNAWTNIAQSFIEGALLECKRGDYTLDDRPIKTGRDGVRIVLLMDSVIAGEIKFDADGKVVDKRVGGSRTASSRPGSSSLAGTERRRLSASASLMTSAAKW